jgi:hypothetical protein
MQTRRLGMCIALVVLVALFVALPAQAGKPVVTEFQAYSTSFDYIEPLVWYTTGAVWHGGSVTIENIESGDARFRGAMTTSWYNIYMPDHAHRPSQIGWGPCTTDWRLDVPDLGGWWEGAGKVYPQTDSRVLTMRATARGYGSFTGMKVEYTLAGGSGWPLYRTVRITEGS